MNTSKGIEKFNGQNFHLFKLRLQLLMKGKGLWDIFTGVDLYNAAHAAPAQLAWKNKDNKAFQILGEHLNDSHRATHPVSREILSGMDNTQGYL